MNQDNHTVKMSLTQESARDVRYERKIQQESNSVSKATKAGYYNYLLGKGTPDWIKPELVSHYNKGSMKAKTLRDLLNQRNLKWTETEFRTESNFTHWATYCEGYLVAEGKERSRIKAENAAFDALM